MIRVLIQYPVAAGVKFDLAYYRDTHVPLVKRVLSSLGMLRNEWDEVLSHPSSGGDAKFHVVSVQYWDSLAAMERAYASSDTRQVKDDVKNFYSGTPQRVISISHSA